MTIYIACRVQQCERTNEAEMQEVKKKIEIEGESVRPNEPAIKSTRSEAIHRYEREIHFIYCASVSHRHHNRLLVIWLYSCWEFVFRRFDNGHLIPSPFFFHSHIMLWRVLLSVYIDTRCKSFPFNFSSLIQWKCEYLFRAARRFRWTMFTFISSFNVPARLDSFVFESCKCKQVIIPRLIGLSAATDDSYYGNCYCFIIVSLNNKMTFTMDPLSILSLNVISILILDAFCKLPYIKYRIGS